MSQSYYDAEFIPESTRKCLASHEMSYVGTSQVDKMLDISSLKRLVGYSRLAQ